ncbi:MAG: FkbM family methyltransferase [Sulfurimonas sp.]|jgi:FkbM family methyltransferase
MKIKIRNFEFQVENDLSFWNNISKWEQYSFNILDKFLNKDSVFIDIGAWNGVLSLYASKIAYKVYSFEPDNIAYENFINNIIKNKLFNISCSNKGISNNEGKNNFYIRTAGDSVSSLIDRQNNNYIANEIKTIETIKLSSFLLNNKINPTLIKMDIEGGEIFVIEEMKDYIKKYTPTMFISFHPAWFPDKDNDIKNVVDILSIYNIYNYNFTQYTKEQFIKSLNSTEHAFIFVK